MNWKQLEQLKWTWLTIFSELMMKPCSTWLFIQQYLWWLIKLPINIIYFSSCECGIIVLFDDTAACKSLHDVQNHHGHTYIVHWLYFYYILWNAISDKKLPGQICQLYEWFLYKIYPESLLPFLRSIQLTYVSPDERTLTCTRTKNVHIARSVNGDVANWLAAESRGVANGISHFGKTYVVCMYVEDWGWVKC